MSDQQVEVTGLNEADLFKSTMANDAPAGDTGSSQDETQDGQPRDERGRFATNKTQDAPAQAQPSTETAPSPQPLTEGQRPPATDDAAANVPSWRLREEREAREAAARRAELAERAAADHERQLAEVRRQMAELQKPKQEPIDPLADPQGYVGQITQTFQQELRRVQLENNLQLAHVRHGDVFPKAFEAFEKAGHSNPAWAQSVVNGPNPGEAIVNWYKREEVLSKVGTDPNAWLEKQLEERLKDPAFLQKAVDAARAQANGQANGTRPNNVTQLPPSLSRVAGSGPDPAADDVTSDQSLFRHATARK